METSKTVKSNNLKMVKKVSMTPEKFRKTNYIGKACFSHENYTKYGSFDNWEIASNIINNLPVGENTFDELILPGNKVKPYLDIEYIKEEKPDLLPSDVKTEILTRLVEIFKDDFNFSLSKNDIYISECHRKKKDQYKYSFHVVVSTTPTIVFEDTNKASFVALKLKDTFRYDDDIIDTGVYKKTQNFRLIGHCKQGEMKPFKLCDHGEELNNKTILTNIDTHSIVLKIPEQHDTLIKNIKNKNNFNLENISQTQINYIIEKVKNELHETAELDKIDTGGYFQFNYTDRYESCFCHKTKITHERIGFFVYIHDFTLYAGCHSGNCSKNNKKIIIPFGILEDTKDYTFFEKVSYDNIFNFDPFFVFKCVDDDAFGISNLFQKMYLEPKRIKWVSGGTKNGITYFWDGNVWMEDDFSYVSRLLVATTVRLLKDTLSTINSNDDVITLSDFDLDREDDPITVNIEKLDKTISNLNSGRIVNNVLKFFQPLTRDLSFLSIKDHHPHFLSCKNGMVDLISGELRPAVPADNITKTIDIAYNPDIFYEPFDNFLKEITSDLNGERPDVYNYLKWCIGYSLQGNPCKKIFIVLYGPHGFNGKSLCLNTISGVLEYYSETMDKSVVLETPKKTAGSHSTELMQLEHARFGILSDTHEDAVLDDGMVKQLTGITDKISAREIYGKQKEFTPKFVPWINTNHPIRINLTDKAMYERFVLIPFELSFVDNPVQDFERKNNPNMANDFLNNKQGILSWLIKASMFYNQNKNMNPPQQILDAKDNYNKLVNPYINFTFTRFIKNESAKIAKGQFLSYYKDYCKENNIKFISKTSEKEFDKYIQIEFSGAHKYYKGFQFIDEEPEDELEM